MKSRPLPKSRNRKSNPSRNRKRKPFPRTRSGKSKINSNKRTPRQKKPEPTKRPTRRPTTIPTRKPTQTPRPTVTPIPTREPNMIPIEQLNQPQPAAQSINAASSDQPILFESGDPGFDFSGYGRILVNQLTRFWRPPSTAPPESRDYAAYVSFTVFRDGTITDLKIVGSSGWPYMDRTVIEAVKRANPVDPLPPTYSSASVKVRVKFNLPLYR